MSEKSPQLDAVKLDGRHQRSATSRARIVQAMLDLVHAGDVSPGVEHVAARAQVGLRSVFRHFKDMDSLYAEMSDVVEAEFRDLAQQPFKSEDWQGKLGEMLDRRIYAFEKMAPYKRAADVHKHRSPLLRAHQERANQEMRESLKAVLPANLRRDAVRLELLDLNMSFEAWMRLRFEQNLTPRRARAVVELAIHAIQAGTEGST